MLLFNVNCSGVLCGKGQVPAAVAVRVDCALHSRVTLSWHSTRVPTDRCPEISTIPNHGLSFADARVPLFHAREESRECMLVEF